MVRSIFWVLGRHSLSFLSYAFEVPQEGRVANCLLSALVWEKFLPQCLFFFFFLPLLPNPFTVENQPEVSVFIPVVGIHLQGLCPTVCHFNLGFLPCIWYSFCLLAIQKSKQYLCASGSILISPWKKTISQEFVKSGRH